MGMVELGQGLGFSQELICVVLVQVLVQDFEGSGLVQIGMLAQVDGGLAATA